MEYVFHTIAPIVSPESEILILGTMPSPKSRADSFYYAHPQNRFWPALALVYGEPAPQTPTEKKALVLRRRLALWDVLRSCTIIGASDASIRNPAANDVAGLLCGTNIQRVLCTGATAARLYRKLLETKTGIPCETLPSPSAANARMSLEQIAAAYAGALLPADRATL
jgi:hypoxanthine-DNA glycosylase